MSPRSVAVSVVDAECDLASRRAARVRRGGGSGPGDEYQGGYDSHPESQAPQDEHRPTMCFPTVGCKAPSPTFAAAGDMAAAAHKRGGSNHESSQVIMA